MFGVRPRAKRVVGALFAAFTAPGSEALFPNDVAEQLRQPNADRLRLACDYIAGMTDDFAQRMYRRITKR